MKNPDAKIMQNPDAFDVIVIGAGHAGCEAAAAAAKLGRAVLLVTLDLKALAFLACNPSIGGTAKGHLVCEIDALGGIMGTVADATALQIRMLNVGKGAAVQSLRAQIDKVEYQHVMKKTLDSVNGITIKEAEVESILTREVEGNVRVCGVKLTNGEIYNAKSVVVATGVYLNSKILIGDTSKDSGPSGFAAANHLTKSLIQLGLDVRRFKTGTPPRVLTQSIDFSKTIEQPGDDDIQSFSFMTAKPIENRVSCHLTYTNAQTHTVIRNNIHRSAMYSGLVTGIGARYCPSIEDKIVRFASAARHQVFLEPESLSLDETYLQGLSSSLPKDVQSAFVHSIEGLENAEIVRDAYAIEYNCINSTQLFPTLEYKQCKGLFFAGQINGTSGYEEAAAQGLVAGINAAGTRFTLSRANSYIGVLIDDLVTLGTNEPYRMFTSRAEHRLALRQDNADLRLTPLGREIGLVDDSRWKVYQKKLGLLEKVRDALNSKTELLIKQGKTLRELNSESQLFKDVPNSILDQVTTDIRYAGYLAREQATVAEYKRCEATTLPAALDYTLVKALRKEAQQKLNSVKPLSIAQAKRISGVTPADIGVLLVWLKKNA